MNGFIVYTIFPSGSISVRTFELDMAAFVTFYLRIHVLFFHMSFAIILVNFFTFVVSMRQVSCMTYQFLISHIKWSRVFQSVALIELNYIPGKLLLYSDWVRIVLLLSWNKFNYLTNKSTDIAPNI